MIRFVGRTLLTFTLSATALWLAGCGSSKPTSQPKTKAPAPPSTPQLPQPISAPEANVHISVAYPVPGQLRPAVDSNFIFGSVGNGNAELNINGTDVPLAKNGAFLAFLPMPPDGVYHLFARRNNDVDSSTVSYAMRSIAVNAGGETPAKSKGVETLDKPLWAKVTRGGDTLQTGSDVTPGAPTPDADRKWFFPRGAELQVIGKQGGNYKVQLERGVDAWVPDSNLTLGENPVRTPDAGAIEPSTGYIDVVLPGDFNAFLITPEGMTLRVRVYGHSYDAAHPPSFNTTSTDPLINNIGFLDNNGSTEYTVLMTKPVWGYKAFYLQNGSLVVRVRRPPTINRSSPLAGLRIMIDPGHPPAGAIGPTGLTEKEANLNIALKLRDQLQAKGATVLMTHTTTEGLVSSTNQVVELGARADLAVRENVDLMVSVHNNAFPDGTNPFNNYGTSTYYYHPFSADLAQQLDHEIAPITGIPNLGANHKSLAICRPTWMPSALTESLYMMFPDQEQALRDPAFLDKLAAAHVRGIEDFVRQRTP